MSRRVDCPECGATNSPSHFRLHGCWSCAMDAEDQANETAFREFMALDEEERWRKVWEKIK